MFTHGKSLVSAAYDIDISFEITNPQIIDNYVFDTDLSPKLHNIRINRNTYEHGNALILPPNDSRSVLDTINELIDYVNCMNKRGFRFSHSAPVSEVDRISFINDLASGVVAGKPIRYVRKKEDITYYRVGYSAQPLFFSIRGLGII